MREHGVRHLLMGGQACILYGGAEFSRDTDLAVLASRDNLDRLRAALTSLNAHVVAVPPFEIEYLERGHAIHLVGAVLPRRHARADAGTLSILARWR